MRPRWRAGVLISAANGTSGWDESADFIVVGFGAAGAAAAITAAEHDASVILLEKQPAEWHTPSTRASGGQCTVVSDAERAVGYFDRCAGGLVPIEVSRAWVEAATTVVSWLEDVVGVKMIRVAGAEHPGWEGAGAVASFGTLEAYPWGDQTRAMAMRQDANAVPRISGGASLFAALERAVGQRDRIGVRYEHPARRLIQDAAGRVTGVEAATPTGTRRFGARRGVVLTCGGYEYDDAMKLGYLRASPVYFYGSPMNTGDGVRMAQAVGADLWHMNSMIGRAIAHVELDGKGYTYYVAVWPGGYVFTDKYGQRFANEHMQAMSRHDFYYELINYDTARAEYPRIPCYWFFDQRRFSAAPIPTGTAAAGPHRYEWSPDSEAEIARGWVTRGDDLADVARRAGVADPEQAAATIAAYNQGCRIQSDPFGRAPESLIPLDQPPYYCMPLWPGGPNTSGGPRRNEHAQIIDVFGDPIPGLYEAGELGEAVGALYPANGGNISDALCFGRIAVEHALGQATGT
jgi:succinate dehydrogenase/fumarate reductase flavoprotein subunit